MISLILDTDLGDDVDDVFALAYAVRHPQINLCAVTTVLGDTGWRAALALRLLDELGVNDVPVAAGAPGGEVNTVTLSGNVFETLKNLDAVGNDLDMNQGGGCGKGGQSPLPVSNGSPHIRIAKCLVGGA